MQQLALMLYSTRPRQWVKNMFLFAALIFDRKLFVIPYLTKTIYGFVLLTLISGAIYITNDFLDLEKDKLHPVKRLRPLPSGQLSKLVAVVMAIVLPLIALPLAYQLNPWFGLILLIYWLQNILYSLWLKHIVILDILLIALGFTYRVAAGATLVDVEQAPIGSPWIYMCVGFGALLVVLGKRRSELNLLSDLASSHRSVLASYNKTYIDLLIYCVSTSTIISYSFYTFNATYHQTKNHSMMLTIPLVVYGIFRYLYLVYVKDEGGTPEQLVFKDRPLMLSIALWIATATLLRYNY
ncbi:MAG TPA: decaprenyl-phosphate phosphoribosyltransferase [Chloroflexi bacterium]|nr:decaprenyl-phosphate phosphoribosyltransferase [Chloroflexota bacterium]